MCKPFILIVIVILAFAGCANPTAPQTPVSHEDDPIIELPAEKVTAVSNSTENLFSGTVKTGAIAVAGKVDSFSGEIENSVTWVTIGSTKSDISGTGIAFGKSIANGIVKTYIGTAAIFASNWYFFSYSKQADFKISSTEMLPMNGTTDSEFVSLYSLNTYGGDVFTRTEFDKLRNHIGPMDVRLYTQNGNVDLTIPARFFELLKTI